MKFAIKHNTRNHYLQKSAWNWSNDLNDATIYTGYEVLARVRAKEFNFNETLVATTQIVAVRESAPKYEEIA